MILVADWLEDHSPAWIHWKQKLVRLPHKGKRIQLKGIRDPPTQCKSISPRKVKGLIRRKAIVHGSQVHRSSPSTEILSVQVTEPSVKLTFTRADVPAPVHELLQYDFFKEPETLPPMRADDHQITLLPGAQPVNVRPYKYSPQQKNEIQKKILTMLKTRVIAHSTSPFASPVLLVKKKNGTWIFCIDYRQLNAITLKKKHPMPVINDLLDELSGASWFTKLDFRSGYHQIQMAAGDEFKTAFKTHHGLMRSK
ncbi:LOW QUALITY PROTEIN: hypothetical protein U9M48_004449 [Paspalum notatum var. saurae]|uniref:Reverse transcriptase domain-containing protein n=1 Tax=Paspalum notatum var. saurae TaxID=547442 RepID=A0AAQ3SHP8_PASNO